MSWYLKPWVRYTAAVPLGVGAWIVSSLVVGIGYFVLTWFFIGLLHLGILAGLLSWIATIGVATKPSGYAVNTAAIVGYEHPGRFAGIMAGLICVICIGTDTAAIILKAPMDLQGHVSLWLASLSAIWSALSLSVAAGRLER